MYTGEGLQISGPFKLEGGDGNGEGRPGPLSQNRQAKGAPGGDSQSIEHQWQTPFLNPDPFHWWYGVENIVKIRINRESCIALLNNDAQINTVTLTFVEERSLNVGPLTDLMAR